MYSNELQHHGILGQKWGVRRFQNADGSLKAAGKARAKKSLTEKVNDYKTKKVKVKIKKARSKQKLIEEKAKLKELKDANKNNEVLKVKRARDKKAEENADRIMDKFFPKQESVPSRGKPNYMSDDDLRAANERMRLESEYRQRVAELYPQQQSNGQKFVTKVVNDVISPVAVDVGKQVTKQLVGQMVNKQMKADVIQLAKKQEESK